MSSETLVTLDRISPYTANLREKVYHAVGSSCLNKQYIITAVVALALAGLVIATCFRLDLPAPILKAFHDVPTTTAVILGITGIGLTALAIYGPIKTSEDLNRTIDLKNVNFTTALDLIGSYLLSDHSPRSSRLANVVGPIFIVIALITGIVLNVPQLSVLDLPVKILTAGACIAIALRSLFIRYHTLPRVIDTITDHAEKHHVRKLPRVLSNHIMREIGRTYYKIHTSLKGRIGKDLNEEEYQRRKELLCASQTRLINKLNALLQSTTITDQSSVDAAIHIFYSYFEECHLLENTHLAQAQERRITLNEDDIRKIVQMLHEKDAAFHATDNFNNPASLIQHLQDGGNDWIRNYLKHLIKLSDLLFNLKINNENPSILTLTQLQATLFLIANLYQEAQELGSHTTSEQLAEQQSLHYGVIIQLLSDSRVTLFTELEKPHIKTILNPQSSQ